MQKQNSLADTQRVFSRTIRSRTDLLPKQLTDGQWIDCPPISLQERLEIYRYAYFFRIESSLRDDFPRVAKRLGSKKFSDTVKRFLIQKPSTFRNIGEISAGFSNFLKVASLSELARWEWAFQLSWMSETDPPSDFTLNDLLIRPFTEWSQLCFLCNPSMGLFESYWDVEGAALRKQKVKQNWLIWTYQGETRSRKISSIEKDLFRSMLAQKSLASLLRMMEKNRFRQDQVSDFFKNGVSQGWIQGIQNRK